MMKLAWFVSEHGFGHASRSAAIMSALAAAESKIAFEIFTAAPAWFFRDSLLAEHRVHFRKTDVGLVQDNAMEENLEATYGQLSRWLPFQEQDVENLAQDIRDLGCEAVVADVSALGIGAARAAGLPTILVENFTWDWIYGAYGSRDSRYFAMASILEELYADVDLRIQTEPWCNDVRASVKVGPVSRATRSSRRQTRRELGVDEREAMIVMSMGGIPWDFEKVEHAKQPNAILVVPGGAESPRREGSVIVLPHRSRFYHPDLIAAADAVIGKLGYSTLAEVWSSGVRMGWIRRGTFPESKPLALWAGRHIPGFEVDGRRLFDRTWVDEIPRLLDVSPGAETRRNGADEAAAAIIDLI